MGYLYSRDYALLIQADLQNQVTRNNPATQYQAERTAQAEATSYLRQKYDFQAEFTDTAVWDNATIYKAKNRVYIDYAAYSAASTYVIGQCVIQAATGYICTTAITTPEAFNAAHWATLGPQYQLYYVTLPYPEFNLNSTYAVGDIVWWKDKLYTCAQKTIVQYPNALPADIQYYQYAAIPYQNTMPDIAGQTQWANATPYTVAAGTLPTDTTKWTLGDNRDQQMVAYLVSIVLYWLHTAIAPRNIPEIRVHGYHAAIEWFKDCSLGHVTPAMPVLQPKQGARVRYGGNVKLQNTY